MSEFTADRVASVSPRLQRVQVGAAPAGSSSSGCSRSRGSTWRRSTRPRAWTTCTSRRRQRIFDDLLPRHVEVQVYRALLESAAAEHAARMIAMDNATKNAAEMIDQLTLYMNKVRQAAITREIIEVVSGAQAL